MEVQDKKKLDAYSLLHEFNMIYGGYVCIDTDICQEFLNEVPVNLHSVENLYDWVISQDKALEVVE